MINIFNASTAPVKKTHRRLNREKATVAVMIAFYCQKQHSCREICPQCSALLDYARQRLDNCLFQEGKTTCGKCPVHCYKPPMRAQIRTVMRYSGPRMIYRHPLLTFQYLIDRIRKKPIALKSEVAL